MSEFEPEPDFETPEYLPIEVIILEGLDAAIAKGWISVQDKIDWIDSYNRTRNSPVKNLTDTD